jgi:hypothetical protein
MGIDAKKWDRLCREEGIGSADPGVGVAITK